MDEKEFLTNVEEDVIKEEENNLKLNILKIEEKIKCSEKRMEQAEADCDSYKGDYEFAEAFVIAKREAGDLKSQIEDLKEALKKSPYHMHIYLEEKGHDEDMYIGLNDIVDIHGKNVVYSIWSEVAKAFYGNQRTFDYKGLKYNLKFKRKIIIENQKLVDIYEEYNDVRGKNEKITDYFLRNILKSKKNISGFTDIVKSIQEKQNDIIRADIKKNIICQGVAGSGKTAIIVHRLSNLLYNNPDIPAEKYLFIAPNSNFKSELNDLNKKLKIDKIKLSTLYEYYIEKINYYFIENFGKNPRYEIKNIMDDNEEDLNNIYTSSYFYNKYNNFLDEIYDSIKEVSDHYKYDFVKKESFRENITNLKKIINFSISAFNEQKSILNRIFKDIKTLSKKIGQSANSIDDVKNFETIIISFKDKAPRIIAQYKILLSNIEKEMIEKRDTIDYDFYFKYNFIKENIEEDIKKLKHRKSIIEEQTQKTEKSLFGPLQSITITKNKNIINDLENEIHELEHKSEYMMSDDYAVKFEEYEKLEKELNNYSNAIICLNEAIDLTNSIIESSKAFKKLVITNDITNDDVISYNRILKNLVNYISLNSEKVDIINIKELKELLIRSINIDLTLDYNRFIEDKNYLSILNENIKPSVLIKKSFSIALNNKYLFTPEEMKKSNFLRSDIVLLLYIFNKLGFSKRKTYEYLYIDEAQDYNDEEIILLNELEGNPIMNVFGDLQQNVSKNSLTRSNWENLKKRLNNNSWYCELNENYRNTVSVVDYCNKKLNSNMTKLGIEGNPVLLKEKVGLSELIKIYNEGNYQIITNNEQLINKIKKINDAVKCNTVLEVKGLEFENIIVIDDKMDRNNKYVAYTRTKNDLIIINEVVFDEDVEDAKSDIQIETAKLEESVKLEQKNEEFKKERVNRNYADEVKIIIENVDNYKIEADILFKYYQKEGLSENINNQIKRRLIINGLINNPNISKFSFDEKIKEIIEIIRDIKYISDTEFVNVLCYYSDNKDEQDKIYEKITNLGYVILEDE